MKDTLLLFGAAILVIVMIFVIAAFLSSSRMPPSQLYNVTVIENNNPTLYMNVKQAKISGQHCSFATPDLRTRIDTTFPCMIVTVQPE